MIRLLLLFMLLLPVSAHAINPADYAFTQRPGQQLPLDMRFTDSAGRTASLGTFLGGKPSILALGYFHCPNLCGLTRSDLLHALRNSGLQAGRDYRLVVLSIDPAELPADARDAETKDLARTPIIDAAKGWAYLTGSATGIDRVERAVGYHASYDTALKQFLHPTGLVFVTPAGSVSGYVLGIGYSAGDIRAAVARAAHSITARALPVLLLCFHFDPTTGRYTLAIMKVLQIAAGLTVLCVGALLFAMHRGKHP
ncbi:MAG TPA: SCO family protein [Acetobacteraceae bacterium]|nr:SCO family protein [Acetobacteraceae bacterium]